MSRICKMDVEENCSIVSHLEEIQQEMLELLSKAQDLISGTREEARAKSYWLAHIKTALTNEHEYLGSSMITMEDSINALRADNDDDEMALDKLSQDQKHYAYRADGQRVRVSIPED